MLSLIVCNDCGKRYSKNATVCPECACPTEINLKGKMKQTVGKNHSIYKKINFEAIDKYQEKYPFLKYGYKRIKDMENNYSNFLKYTGIICFIISFYIGTGWEHSTSDKIAVGLIIGVVFTFIYLAIILVLQMIIAILHKLIDRRLIYTHMFQNEVENYYISKLKYYQDRPPVPMEDIKILSQIRRDLDGSIFTNTSEGDIVKDALELRADAIINMHSNSNEYTKMHQSYYGTSEKNAKMDVKNGTAVKFIDVPYYEDDFVISEKLEKKFGKLIK